MRSDAAREENTLKTTHIIAPHWGAMFLMIGGAFLLLLGVWVRFLLGFSAASDQVFAIEALISGLAADLVFRRFMRRRLVVAPKVEIPFMYIWPLLCLYVFIARPFE
jgi:hypothetical protein